MGSLQSSIVPQVVVSAIVVVGLGVGFWLASRPQAPPPVKPQQPKAQPGKKGKKKKAAGGEGGLSTTRSEPRLPGGHPTLDRLDVDDDGQTTTSVPDEGAATPSGRTPSKKKRKTKSKTSSATPTTKSVVPPPPVRGSSSGAGPSSWDADGPWTRVETRRRGNSTRSASAAGTAHSGSDLLKEGSEGGVTTSVTEEDGGESIDGEAKSAAEGVISTSATTPVDGTPDTPMQNGVRVVRVKPTPADKPAVGFSWADYEDVEDMGGEADGEDDAGEWGIVKGRNSRSRSQAASSSGGSVSQPRPSRAPETLTKKQRQNARKREAEKALKGDTEAERLAALTRHKRELENQRIAEAAAQAKKASKALSGGMRASVNDKGALVWE